MSIYVICNSYEINMDTKCIMHNGNIVSMETIPCDLFFELMNSKIYNKSGCDYATIRNNIWHDNDLSQSAKNAIYTAVGKIKNAFNKQQIVKNNRKEGIYYIDAEIKKKTDNVSGWKEELEQKQNNIFLSSRQKNERNILIENRIGNDKIKKISMLCYANSIILSPGQNHVDLMAYDDNKSHDVVYNILANSKTNVEMILTTPDSEAMKEAIKSKKLGNDAKENREQEIFYEARDNVKDPEGIFVKAARENRFKLYYTNISLPYALFITEYEDGYEFLDNIKVDLYSPYIGSSVRRRTFYVFREDTENFEFFLRNYEDIKSHTENTKREDLL